MKDYQDEFDKKVRAILTNELTKCTERQRDFFNRMYKSVDQIPLEKMRGAYSQIKRTLEKNN